MNYLEKNPQRWYKAQSHRWLGSRISTKGAFFEYDPFKTPADLYQDFLLLMQKVDAYRTAFSIVGEAEVRRNRHKIGIKKKVCDDAKSEMMKQYITFTDRWGMLGVGFSRIIDTAHTGHQSKISGINGGSNGSYKRDIIHELGKVKRLILHEADTAFDLNLAERNNKKELKYDRFNKIYPDSLPVSGGLVPLTVWEKDYISIDMRRYSESIDSLAGCRELLGIWSDINDPDGDEEIKFHPAAVAVTGKTMAWQFNSLIQAIQIIHVLNKTSQLNNLWEICRECASMFSKRYKHQRKFCSETCRNTAKVRNYREKKKNAT